MLAVIRLRGSKLSIAPTRRAGRERRTWERTKNLRSKRFMARGLLWQENRQREPPGRRDRLLRGVPDQTYRPYLAKRRRVPICYSESRSAALVASPFRHR